MGLPCRTARSRTGHRSRARPNPGRRRSFRQSLLAHFRPRRRAFRLFAHSPLGPLSQNGQGSLPRRPLHHRIHPLTHLAGLVQRPRHSGRQSNRLVILSEAKDLNVLSFLQTRRPAILTGEPTQESRPNRNQPHTVTRFYPFTSFSYILRRYFFTEEPMASASQPVPTPEQNKKLILRWFEELWNQGNRDV